MSDARGQARALTVLTPVARGRTPDLRKTLERLPPGELSPLARLPGTHFARFAIVTDLGGDQLLFSSTFDVHPPGYLGEICSRMPEEADEIWSHCDGYPGTADPEGFVQYLERHRVKTTLFVAAYPDATLDDVRDGLALRGRLAEFVAPAQSMTPEELQAAFHERVLVEPRERQVVRSG